MSLIELACYSKDCAPPPVGKGGSKPGIVIVGQVSDPLKRSGPDDSRSFEDRVAEIEAIPVDAPPGAVVLEGPVDIGLRHDENLAVRIDGAWTPVDRSMVTKAAKSGDVPEIVSDLVNETQERLEDRDYTHVVLYRTVTGSEGDPLEGAVGAWGGHMSGRGGKSSGITSWSTTPGPALEFVPTEGGESSRIVKALVPVSHIVSYETIGGWTRTWGDPEWETVRSEVLVARDPSIVQRLWDGDNVAASALVELACHSKECAPPPVGKGGSQPGGGSLTYFTVQNDVPERESLWSTPDPWLDEVPQIPDDVLRWVASSAVLPEVPAEDPAFTIRPQYAQWVAQDMVDRIDRGLPPDPEQHAQLWRQLTRTYNARAMLSNALHKGVRSPEELRLYQIVHEHFLRTATRLGYGEEVPLERMAGTRSPFAPTRWKADSANPDKPGSGFVSFFRENALPLLSKEGAPGAFKKVEKLADGSERVTWFTDAPTPVKDLPLIKDQPHENWQPGNPHYDAGSRYTGKLPREDILGRMGDMHEELIAAAPGRVQEFLRTGQPMTKPDKLFASALIELACHDKSCAPPPVGKGGSSPSSGKIPFTVVSTFTPDGPTMLRPMSDDEAEAALRSAKVDVPEGAVLFDGSDSLDMNTSIQARTVTREDLSKVVKALKNDEDWQSLDLRWSYESYQDAVVYLWRRAGGDRSRVPLYADRTTGRSAGDVARDTQDALRTAGATHVVLYRGVDRDFKDGDDPFSGRSTGSRYLVPGENTSGTTSWTTDPAVAALFGSKVVKAAVPVEHVLSFDIIGNQVPKPNDDAFVPNGTRNTGLRTVATGKEVIVADDASVVSRLVAGSSVTAAGLIDLACHDASCAPPPVGTGGSNGGSANGAVYQRVSIDRYDDGAAEQLRSAKVPGVAEGAVLFTEGTVRVRGPEGLKRGNVYRNEISDRSKGVIISDDQEQTIREVVGFSQEALKAAGITHVVLYRGVAQDSTADPFDRASSGAGSNPGESSGITSWTTKPELAVEYAETYGGMRVQVVKAVVPVEQVVSFDLIGVKSAFGDVPWIRPEAADLPGTEVLVAANPQVVGRLTASALLAACHEAACAPPPVGTGGSSPSAKYPGMRPMREGDEERLKAKGIKIPPAWTDVHVAEDLDNDKLLVRATGTDGKGRPDAKYLYSKEHEYAAAYSKFVRVKALHQHIRTLDSGISSHAMTDDSAAALLLIRHFGLRPGSTADTGARKQAYGATTLQARHVRQYPETGRTTLSFVGKSGKKITVTTRDPEVYKVIEARLAGKQGTDRLFETSGDNLQDFLHRYVPDQFKVKDLRTYKANVTAIELVSRMRRPKTWAEFRKKRAQVADEVAKQLGNTRAVALGSYIDTMVPPTVFQAWEEALGVEP